MPRIVRDIQLLVNDDDDHLYGYRLSDGTEVRIGTSRPDNASAVVGAAGVYPVKPRIGEILTKAAKIADRLTNENQTVGTTPAAYPNPIDNTVLDIDGATRSITPADNTQHELRFPSRTIVADPDDLSISIPIYINKPIDAFVANKALIGLVLSNTTSVGSNYDQWTFGSDFLRQGRNILRVRSADTIGSANAGNLPFGVSRSRIGTGVDFTQPIQYVGLQFTNMAGIKINIGDVWRSATQRPLFLFGMDATGSPGDEDNFLTVLAPLCRQYGIPGYVTHTHVYEGVSAFGATYLRTKRLVEEWGWEVTGHGWSHGGTEVGRVAPVTLARTSNTVTATFAAAHNIPLNRRFRVCIRDASPSDLNGIFDAYADTTTTIKYTATGVNGSGIAANLYTFMAQVFDVDNATNEVWLTREMADNKREMMALGFAKAAHTFAYPNNSVPELELHKRVCAKAGITIGRGVRGGFVFADQLGIDNPLEFGSYVMDSGSFATRTSTIIAKLESAWARKESFSLYGHYVQDERPLIAAGQTIDLDYPPGSGGNPAPPGGALSGTGGWWYRGQIEAVFRRVVELGFAPVSFSEFARMFGKGV